MSEVERSARMQTRVERMTKRSIAFLILRGTCVIVLTTACWAILGYLATAPLGALYGWSGHPSIPNAPVSVYIGLYLIVLPILCLFVAWKLVSVIFRVIAVRAESSKDNAQ